MRRTRPPVPPAMRETAITAALKAPVCRHEVASGDRCVPCLVDAALTAALQRSTVRWSYQTRHDVESTDLGWDTLDEGEARQEARTLPGAAVVFRFSTPWYTAPDIGR